MMSRVRGRDRKAELALPKDFTLGGIDIASTTGDFPGLLTLCFRDTAQLCLFMVADPHHLCS